MTELPVWHGTSAEGLALAETIHRYCTCDLNGLGQVRTCCASHRMLVVDQRALDGLLFWRHAAAVLTHDEFSPCPHGHTLRAPTVALPDESTGGPA